ncbi:MAG: 50S ribosomal protein L25 [Chloroflexota bacterium]|nr:50S ribosomal protein L25 [Chloroflexota bacterium]
MEVTTLQLEPRTVLGKKVKQLRQKGYTPVHLYGSGIGASSHQIETQVLGQIIPEVGTNIPITVKVSGDETDHVCFIREIQRHPVSEELLHVDFLRVDVTKSIQSRVPITLLGEPPAVQNLGGTLIQAQQFLIIESLPLDVPGSVSIDISDLDTFEKAVYIRDIIVGDNVTVTADPDQMVARVIAPRIEIEEEVETEEIEGEEGLEGEESEDSEPTEE